MRDDDALKWQRGSALVQTMMMIDTPSEGACCGAAACRACVSLSMGTSEMRMYQRQGEGWKGVPVPCSFSLASGECSRIGYKCGEGGVGGCSNMKERAFRASSGLVFAHGVEWRMCMCVRMCGRGGEEERERERDSRKGRVHA